MESVCNCVDVAVVFLYLILVQSLKLNENQHADALWIFSSCKLLGSFSKCVDMI